MPTPLGMPMDEDNPMGLRPEPGYDGMFTRAQAEGAWPNGTRIVKGVSEPGDATANGTPGVVIGSVGPIPYKGSDRVYGYFIEWDDKPKMVVLVANYNGRIREALNG